MNLFEVTNLETGEVKIIMAKHEFGAKWLAAGNKKDIKLWRCKHYPEPYRLHGDKVEIKNPYTYLWEDAEIVATRNVMLLYVGAVVELKRKGKLKA